MGPIGGAVTARARLVLAVLVSAAVAWLLPWLTATSADGASLLLTTSIALVALAGLHARGTVRAAAAPASPRPPTEAGGDVFLAGRVTDAPHHPLRPRAPGLV
jgi:hypothetical protein